MSNSGGPSGSWTRCICSVCSGHLEFDSDLAGETIQCPHCGMPTILFIPRTPLPLPAGRPPKSIVCPDCGTNVEATALSCMGCGRVMERPVPVPIPERAPLPTGLGPTAAGAWLVLAILLVVVVGGPIFWWRTQYSQVPKPETELQQMARLQSESEGEMFKECTNVIIGLNRIIHFSLNIADDNPYKWSGKATVEFVNRVGGIERTNLDFKFGTDTGRDGLVHLRCSTESEAEAERRLRQHNDKREIGRSVVHK